VLLTIETTGTSTDSAIRATDLGFLLHKHPDRVQQFATPSGVASVFYSIADPGRCRAVLHVGGENVSPKTLGAADRYVNTLPYAGSSRLMVAMAKVLSEALHGRCANRPDLIDVIWQLRVVVGSVPVAGGDVELVHRFFSPLGWTVTATPTLLQPHEWGPSRFVQLELNGASTVRDALAHLYVLIPALASDKHYFIGDDEVDKLLRIGAGWLADHPEREPISRRYLKGLADLGDDALAQLVPDVVTDAPAPRRQASMQNLRRVAVIDSLRAVGARSVLDAGCGEGTLLRALAGEPGIGRLAGVDVSMAALARAHESLSRFSAVELWQSSLMYADSRCRSFDAVVLMEVIEHVEPDRLDTLESSVFETMAPSSVIVTTPNREHNVRYGLTDNEFRHPDHRFEFTRSEFAQWCGRVAADYGYTVTTASIGTDDPEVGSSSQLAVFRRIDGSERHAVSCQDRQPAAGESKSS
jgi:3' terminal RNA ribose 2'-O-methyltransferase Hen1